MSITLYVLKSRMTGKRYVGITADLDRRLQEHTRGGTKGGQLLGAFTLFHTEEFPDRQSARIREKFLESGQGREWLESSEGE